MRGKIFRVSRWFRRARKPLLTACGRMAKSAKRCSPRPSRGFAKRAMEQRAQNSLPLHVADDCIVFLFLFPFVPTVAFASVFSMFPVFLA